MTDGPQYETTPDEILVRLRQSRHNPRVGKTFDMKLKDGPRAFRFLTIQEIIDPETGALHHHRLRIDSFDRTKRRGWEHRPDRSVAIDSDEIERLVGFIRTVCGEPTPTEEGEYHLLDSRTYSGLRDTLAVARAATSQQKLDLLRLVFETIEAETIKADEWRDLLKGGTSALLRGVGTTARIIEYTNRYHELKKLIETPGTTEQPLQKLLSRNPWMFGSEYSRLEDRRRWVRDSELDFMLRRSSDGFLEIVEIKTPTDKPLFHPDKSHNCFYPSAMLSAVVGQVIHYIGEIDRTLESIRNQDKVDPLKVRARIIIGRDAKDPEEMAALRNFNAHLHRIEIITFDQLRRIARQALFTSGELEEESPF